MGTLPAGAATLQCGPRCIQVFSAKFGTNASPGFVETVFQRVAAAGQPTIMAPQQFQPGRGPHRYASRLGGPGV